MRSLLVASALPLVLTTSTAYAVLDSRDGQQPASDVIDMEVRLGDNNVCKDFNNRDQFLQTARKFVDLPIEAIPNVREKDVIGIAFFDRQGAPVSVSAAGVTQIRITAASGSDPLISVGPADPIVAPYIQKACVPIGPGSSLASKLRNLKHNTSLTVQVTSTLSSTGLSPRYSLRQNRWEPSGYNIVNNGSVGIWFPVGLLGSNLQQTDQGFEFSALPIGVALGGKYWVNDDFYLGLSGAFSWSIASTEVKETDPMTMMEVTKSVTTAKAIGYGALIDLGSYVYLGYMYQNDLSSADADPGHTVVVGLGPELLKLLADFAKR